MQVEVVKWGNSSAMRLPAAALKEFGSIDILVNNAGVGMRFIKPDNLEKPVRFWEVPVDRWQAHHRRLLHDFAPAAQDGQGWRPLQP